jgi:hypothetical protein
MTLSIGNTAIDIGNALDRNKVLASVMGSIPVASLACIGLVLMVCSINSELVPRLVYGYIVVLVCMLGVSRFVAKGVAKNKTGAAEQDFSVWMSNAASTPTIIRSGPTTPAQHSTSFGTGDSDIDAFLSS